MFLMLFDHIYSKEICICIYMYVYRHLNILQSPIKHCTIQPAKTTWSSNTTASYSAITRQGSVGSITASTIKDLLINLPTVSVHTIHIYSWHNQPPLNHTPRNPRTALVLSLNLPLMTNYGIYQHFESSILN